MSSRRGKWWSFRTIGGVYVWILVIALFGALRPSTFLTVTTVHTVLNEYSITAIVALSLVVPLAAGVFDLSVGASMGMGQIMVAWLLANTGMSGEEAILVTLCVGLAIGAVNALIVVGLGIDSFIGTLATGGIIDALGVAVSKNQVISGRVAESFATVLGGNIFAGLTAPVFCAVGLMLVLGYVLGFTKIGRMWYAVGFGKETSRLVGARVDRVQALSLMVSGFVATGAGVFLAASTASATPGAGDAYLLPAFAAVFLGATQFLHGRFNTWGTVLAVFLLGTGEYGLLLAGAPQWSPDVFQGAALIIAVGLTSIGGDGVVWRMLRRSVFRRRGAASSMLGGGGSAGGADGAAPSTPSENEIAAVEQTARTVISE